MYVGEWIDDAMTGYGTLSIMGHGNIKQIYQGNTYSHYSFSVSSTINTKHIHIFPLGDFVEGRYHGAGSMTYTNGDIYTGQWKNGKRDGKVR